MKKEIKQLLYLKQDSINPYLQRNGVRFSVMVGKDKRKVNHVSFFSKGAKCFTNMQLSFI